MKKIAMFSALVVSAFLFARQADATLITFTSRTTWASNVSGRIFIEDFETDPGGFAAITTPYLTAGRGILMQDLLGPIDFQILPSGSGLVNGTQGPHFRDFGNMMSFSFPGGIDVAAFAFDYFYNRSEEAWQLQVNNVVLTLTPSGTFPSPANFIGIVSTGAPISFFVLTSSAFAQGGLSIDGLSFSPVPEPATLVLFGSGLAALGAGAWRRRHSK